VRGAWAPLYASPQQQEGKPPDPRDDVYALGILWYQLMVGHPLATPGKDYVHELDVRGLRRSAVTLLGACVANWDAQRPGDAAELAERLAALDKEQDEPERVAATPAAAKPAPAGPDEGALYTVDLGGGVDMKFAPLEPGPLLMGSPSHEEESGDDEGPQHVVTITEEFHLGIYPVTQAQWRAVMGSVPEGLKGDAHPVTLVSLTQRLGRPRTSSSPSLFPRPVFVWDSLGMYNAAQALCKEGSDMVSADTKSVIERAKRIYAEQLRALLRAPVSVSRDGGARTSWRGGTSLDSTRSGRALY
jgi:hypothetical protein